MAEDDTVLLVEEDQVVWRREEGLARVQSTLFLDLPAAAADMEADYKAMRPSLMDRVNAEVLTVKVEPILHKLAILLRVSLLTVLQHAAEPFTYYDQFRQGSPWKVFFGSAK